MPIIASDPSLTYLSPHPNEAFDESFSNYLRSLPLTSLRNQPPDPTANAVFIGPTAINLAIASSPIAPNEQALLALWKRQDLAAYMRSSHDKAYRRSHRFF